MSRNLIKIEAEDTSPLDVPGRPLTTIRPDPNQSWDQQITPADFEDEHEQAPSMRRFGAPEPAPPRRAPRIEDLLPPPVDTQSTPAPEAPAEPQPIPEPTPTPPTEPKAQPEPEAEPVAKPEQKPEPDAPKRLPPRLRKQKEQEPKKPDAPDAVPQSDPKGAADALVAKQSETTPQPPPTPKPAPAAPVAEAPAPRPAAGGRPVPPPARPARAYQRRYDEAGVATAVAAAMPMPAPPIAAPAPDGGGGGGGGPPDTPDGPDIPAIAPERPPLPSDEDIRRGAMAGLKDSTDLSNCVLPLLEALNWRGDPRHVAEALPHFINNIDITAFRNIMATLHYESRPVKITLREIDPRLMPCIFLPEDGGALVLFSRTLQTIQTFDGELDDFGTIAPIKKQGTAYFFSPVEAEDMVSAQQKVGWFRAVTERFRSLFYQTLGITLILNLLALATPLFVMAVYDKVVATGSIPTLAYFAVGVGIAIGCDLILRSVRAKIMAFVGARLDNIVGLAIFHKILFLPPSLTERSTVGAQVARIKDFETIRDFFTGPMALTLLEVPFAFIFLAVIINLAGPLVWIPVIMVALYGILALVFTPLIRATVSRAARASSRRQELVVETLNSMRAVKYCGAEATWLDRYRDLSSKSALNSFYTSQLSSIVQTLSHVLMVGSGVGTIVFGVFRVLEGEMTVGSLVATMMLVWRVLGPLQTGFISMSRITQVRASIGQINNLMNIRAEREQHSQATPLKRFDGFVSFARVSIRYSPEADPALVGVSFEAEPGEVICVVGGNGSGKSTVLKLLAGMYQAQAGSIRVDNMDIRQMDTVELRHAVGYVPQSLEFFYGTISQNLRLAHPTATDDDLRWACHKAGVLEDVLALEQGSGKWQRTGFDVRIGDTGVASMPTSMLQRLNLARGYLKQAPIMLFDEPGNGLDFEGDQTFMRMVDEMRGEQTVLIVTHRPSHLRIADKILWLEYGNVRAYGPAEDVLKEMPKDFL